MKRLLIAALIFACSGSAIAQQLPSYMGTMAAPTIQVDVNGNPVGGGGGGGPSTITGAQTAPGTSATQPVGVQGVAGGVPQNVAGTVTANQGTAGVSPWPVSVSTGGYSGAAATAAGTGGTTATPVQGVVNGVPQNTVQPDRSFTVSATSAAPLIGTGTDQTTGGILTNGLTSVSMQFLAGGVGTIIGEESNDNVTYTANGGGINITTNSGTALTTNGLATVGIIKFHVDSAYVRFRASPYTSGTLSASVILKAGSVGPISVYTTPSVGTVAATPNRTAEVGSATAADAIVPAIAGSAASGVVIKAAPGNLYSAYATCTAACWLMVFNSVAIPADGTTTSGVASGNLQDCIPIAAGQSGSVNYGAGPAEVFTVGISAAVSSTACATKTAATTGFVHGSAR